jgi:glucose-1-phosphate thymidylyltransferase
MKGVILAGGTGTRLQPLTKMINKHLLPVGRLPMIYHGLFKLREAGIHDVLLVVSGQSAGQYAQLLGSGSELGMEITYKVQEEAGGIPQALALAKSFIGDYNRFVVLLGDNLFDEPLEPYVERFRHSAGHAMVILKEVGDARRYGVPTMLEGKILSIDEKPAIPKSNYCVTGIYFYDSQVFDYIARLQPSKRGELEITDLNNVYAQNNTLHYSILNGWWTDAGTFESLREANDRMNELGGDER